MPEPIIDFEGNHQNNPGGAEPINPPVNPPANPPAAQEPTNLDNIPPANPPAEPTEPLHDYEVGTEIEFDGVTYTVAENGDVVDAEGNVFKEAKDVKAWVDEMSEGGDDEISIDSIKESIGVDIVDENGNPIEFTNDAAGIKSYVDSVIGIKAEEIRQGTINKLFADNPMLKDFVDYVQLTGSPVGFGDLPDRSGIEIDKDNVEQQIAIIRMAATEFGNKSLDENYIKYLQSTGALYDVAQEQLDALVEKDEATREELATRAEEARQQEFAETQEYFNTVANAIQNRRIGQYLLPENITREINGQKITNSLSDFYKYVANATEVTEDGSRITGYQRDLDSLTDQEALNRELLDAWLMFTGGTYADLVNMAVKEEQARKLILKSKEARAAHHVKLNKPTSKGDKNQLLFE